MKTKIIDQSWVMTGNAAALLDRQDIFTALQRHYRGDWGDLCSTDKAVNDEALATGRGLLSLFEDKNGTKFLIITDIRLNLTTVLLPEEY